MTKKEVDKYFTENFSTIQKKVNQFKNLCATKNKVDITTDVYLLCVDKCHKIEKDKIDAFISSSIYNIYKHSASSLNYKTNKVFANNIDLNSINIVDDDFDSLDVKIQNMEYLFQKYLNDAKPSEKIFFDIYVKENIRSVRKLKKRLKVSHYGAWILINDFKNKLKSYEGKEQVKN